MRVKVSSLGYNKAFFLGIATSPEQSTVSAIPAVKVFQWENRS
jgi:hypothetical protein